MSSHIFIHFSLSSKHFDMLEMTFVDLAPVFPTVCAKKTNSDCPYASMCLLFGTYVKQCNH